MHACTPSRCARSAAVQPAVGSNASTSASDVWPAQLVPGSYQSVDAAMSRYVARRPGRRRRRGRRRRGGGTPRPTSTPPRSRRRAQRPLGALLPHADLPTGDAPDERDDLAQERRPDLVRTADAARRRPALGGGRARPRARRAPRRRRGAATATGTASASAPNTASRNGHVAATPGLSTLSTKCWTLRAPLVSSGSTSSGTAARAAKQWPGRSISGTIVMPAGAGAVVPAGDVGAVVRAAVRRRAGAEQRRHRQARGRATRRRR